METKIKRPPSVLIAQTLSILFALIALIPHFVVISDFFERGHFFIPGATVDVLTISGAIAFLFFIAFVGMMIRKSFGRWMAVGLFALLPVLFFVNGLQEYSSGRRSTNWPLMAFVMFPVLMLLMLYVVQQLAFGKRVAAYFRKEQIPVQ